MTTTPTSPSFVRASGVGPERPASDLRAIREMLYSDDTTDLDADLTGWVSTEEAQRLQAARYRLMYGDPWIKATLAGRVSEGSRVLASFSCPHCSHLWHRAADCTVKPLFTHEQRCVCPQ